MKHLKKFNEGVIDTVKKGWDYISTPSKNITSNSQNIEFVKDILDGIGSKKYHFDTIKHNTEDRDFDGSYNDISFSLKEFPNDKFRYDYTGKYICLYKNDSLLLRNIPKKTNGEFGNTTNNDWELNHDLWSVVNDEYGANAAYRAKYNSDLGDVAQSRLMRDEERNQKYKQNI